MGFVRPRAKRTEARGVTILVTQGDELRRRRKDAPKTEPCLSELLQDTLNVVLFGPNPTRDELLKLLAKQKTEMEALVLKTKNGK